MVGAAADSAHGGNGGRVTCGVNSHSDLRGERRVCKSLSLALDDLREGGTVNQTAAGGLGLVGMALVLIGGYLLVSGLLSHDPWGFSKVIAAVGFVMILIGLLLFARSRTSTKKKP